MTHNIIVDQWDTRSELFGPFSPEDYYVLHTALWTPSDHVWLPSTRPSDTPFQVERVSTQKLSFSKLVLHEKAILQSQNMRKYSSPFTTRIRGAAKRGNELRISWLLGRGFRQYIGRVTTLRMAGSTDVELAILDFTSSSDRCVWQEVLSVEKGAA